MQTKMYCSKYALTNGITEHEGVIHQFTFQPKDWWCTYWMIGKEAHESYEEACARAEQLRLKKIASLQKQLIKLQEMKFDHR